MKTQLIKLKEPLTTSAGTMMCGLYQVVGGPVPKSMRDVGILVDGPAPADVKVVDAAQFERDEKRFLEPAAAPPKATIDRPTLLARFGWETQQLEQVGSLGFPAPMVRFDRRGPVPTWLVRDIDKWEKQLATLGFAHQTR